MSDHVFRSLILVAVGSFTAVMLFADGGTLQLHQQAGPFMVTAFSAPVPLRAGVADLSVMVQDGQEDLVPDADVTIRLSKRGEEDIIAKANTAQAANKLLYAAQVTIPSAGQWRMAVLVTRGGHTGSVTGTISVLPEEAPFLTYWVYFAIVPLGVLLFVLNQWLKKKQRRPQKT